MDGLSVPAHGFKLIAGPANPDLCGEIATMLDVPFCKTTVNRFADGEIFVRIDENVRDRKSTRLNSSHLVISYAVFCLKKKKLVTCLHHNQESHVRRRIASVEMS